MESKISLSTLVPPLIKSLVILWKFVFPLVEQSTSSGSGVAAIVYLRLTGAYCALLENTEAKITEIFAEIITWNISNNSQTKVTNTFSLRGWPIARAHPTLLISKTNTRM